SCCSSSCGPGAGTRRSGGARLQLHQHPTVEVDADEELTGLEEGRQQLLRKVDDVHASVGLVGQHGLEVGQDLHQVEVGNLERLAVDHDVGLALSHLSH